MLGDVDSQLAQQADGAVVVEHAGEAEGVGGGHVAADGLSVDANDAGDGLLRHALAEQLDDFSDLEHRHLAKRHVASGSAGAMVAEGGNGGEKPRGESS